MASTRSTRRRRLGALALAAATSLAVGCSSSGTAQDDTSSAATPKADRVLAVVGDKPVATLSPRFQSYNIEMIEVTGGDFWKPYDAGPGKSTRPPIDLSSPRLRNLARALGPSYIRVSGSWANSTYFDVDGTTGGKAPAGYGGVLTTQQWQGVGDFATAIDGEVVTSFAVNTGSRDANGVWKPDQAEALLTFSQAHDVPLAAAEFSNEPSLNIGVPSGYTGEDYARDYDIFQKMVKRVMPKLLLVGPGAVEDATPLMMTPAIPVADMTASSASTLDVFSYHFYPKVSARCGSKEGPEIALTSEFLSRIMADKVFYEGVRDKYLPNKPIWVTETAEAACGGDRWAAQYADVFRYLDTLGRLGTGDGDVVFHNTLAASDYGLIDEADLTPRPDYWAGVLWQKLMGQKVLKVEAARANPELTVYANCTAGSKQATVTYAVLNTSATETRTVTTTSGEAQVYLLTGSSMDAKDISLNGTVLEANADGTLPKLEGVKATGAVKVPPASVAFVVEPTKAAACS